MQIKDLQARQGDVELTAKVVDKANPREFDKFGKKGRVCNAKLKDDTGSVSLTLWNEEIDLVDVGDTVKITKGYVGEWQGELQLSAGKFGKIEIIEKVEKTQSEKPKNHTQKSIGEIEQREEELMQPEEEFDDEEDVI
jgi:replication factor A1